MAALDAAFPFDYEHRMRVRMQSANTLKIGIVGFGTFGQFLAKRFVKAGHQVGGSAAGVEAVWNAHTGST